MEKIAVCIGAAIAGVFIIWLPISPFLPEKYAIFTYANSTGPTPLWFDIVLGYMVGAPILYRSVEGIYNRVLDKREHYEYYYRLIDDYKQLTDRYEKLEYNHRNATRQNAFYEKKIGALAAENEELKELKAENSALSQKLREEKEYSRKVQNELYKTIYERNKLQKEEEHRDTNEGKFTSQNDMMIKAFDNFLKMSGGVFLTSRCANEIRIPFITQLAACSEDLKRLQGIIDYEKVSCSWLVNILFDLLASGTYHIRPGKLSIDGEAMLNVYRSAMYWAVDHKFITKQEYQEQVDLLTRKIAFAG